MAQQRARIEELELLQSSSDAQSLREEVEQLHAIIEAQEEALSDQKSIIASQSSLLDELSGQLTRSTALSILPTSVEEEEDLPPSPSSTSLSGTGSRASTGPSSATGHHAASGPRPRQSGVPVSGRPGAGHSGVDVGRGGVPQRRAGAPPAAVTRSNGATSGAARSIGGSTPSTQNSRSQREQLLAQKLLNRVGTSSAASVEHPRAPRPNSNYGRQETFARNGATPRARSLNATPDRGSSGGSSARGPSPTRSPDVSQGYHPSASMGPPSRKLGGPLPPALPLLRQEA